MRRTKHSIRLLAALLLLPFGVSAYGQTTSGGSSYSIFNIGDLRSGSTGASAGRGGIEASIPSPSSINSINPAGWSDLRQVTLQAAMNFEQYQVSDLNGKLFQNTSRIQEFGMAFPFNPNKGGTIALSIHPYSTVSYLTRLERDVPVIDSTTRAQIANSGHGGISQFTGGVSYKPTTWLALGAAVNAYFGSIKTESSITFPNASLNPAIYATNDLYIGWGGTGGVSVDVNEDLRIGAAFESGTNATREHQARSAYRDNDSTVTRLTDSTQSELTIPSRVVAGASWVLGRSLLSAEGSFQNWGTEQFTTARPSWRAAVGYDYLPSRSVNATGLERWTFRMGGYYENTYYKAPGSDGINQMGVTLGARYPIGNLGRISSSTAFDVALDLGTRGTTTGNLTQELYGKIWFELSISELWFVRSR